MKSEPALIISAVMGVIEAALALLVAFGLGLTAEQTGALLAFAAAVGAVVSGLFIRSQVYSPATANDLIDADAVISRAENEGGNTNVVYLLVVVILVIVVLKLVFGAL